MQEKLWEERSENQKTRKKRKKNEKRVLTFEVKSDSINESRGAVNAKHGTEP